MSNVKPEVKELAASIQQDMEIDGNGVIATNNDVYEKHLPESLTMETVNQVGAYNERFVAGFTLATGNMGQDVMKKDKNLSQVSAQTKLGKYGDVNTVYDRTRVGPKSIADRTEVTRYGQTTTRVRTFAGKNKGDLKKVREELSAVAESMFK